MKFTYFLVDVMQFIQLTFLSLIFLRIFRRVC